MHRLSSRVLDALLLLWLVTTITFALIHLAPGDPATLLISPTASADEAARQRTALGLDAPLPMQYARWLGGVLRGDLGESLVRAEPVTRVITEALPVSLFLGGVSLLASFVLGTMLGLLQALRVSRRADRVITAIATAIYAAPSFWLALAMVTLFTSGVVWLGLPASMRLPAFGMQDPTADFDQIPAPKRNKELCLEAVRVLALRIAAVPADVVDDDIRLATVEAMDPEYQIDTLLEAHTWSKPLAMMALDYDLNITLNELRPELRDDREVCEVAVYVRYENLAWVPEKHMDLEMCLVGRHHGSDLLRSVPERLRERVAADLGLE